MATSEQASSAGMKRKADEMDSADSETTATKTHRNAKVIEILPGADVILQVGDGKDALDIKVSGVVLSLASKVFKVMLNSQFIGK